MNWVPRLTGQTPSVIDLFCGYGGWTTAAGYLNLWTKRALNHWEHAIEVHSQNHPLTSHYLGDVKQTRPSEHPVTDLFMGSPTCTDFSQADPKNLLTLNGQRPLFEVDQREYERLVAQHQGRATMFDVIEFIDYHKYHYGVIENVVEVHRWGLFDHWRRDLARAGYEYRFLYLNSMFFHELNGVPAGIPPIPQSRDRWYCVFWRKGNPAPNLDFRPLAPCSCCGRDVRAIQVWKNKKWGKYGLTHGQYYWGCPVCKERHRGNYRPLPVEPYYYAGINAIDFSLPIMKVGDPRRKPPISANTRKRIQAGLNKYGWEPLILDLQRTNGNSMKYRSALFPLYTQTKTASQAVAIPAILVNLTHPHGKDEGQIKGWEQPLPVQTTKGTQAVAIPPFMVELYGGGNARPSTDPLNTVTAGAGKSALVVPPAFFTLNYGGRETTGPVHPLNTQTAHGYPNSLVLPPSFFTVNRDTTRSRTRSPDEPLPVMATAGAQVGLVLPFALTYNGGHSVLTNFDEALSTVTTTERHGFTWPRPTVEDCYYRTIRAKIKKTGSNGAMHNESEIGRAMGFPIGPDGYKFDGSTDDITKGFGNAITPAVGVWILSRILEAMQ